MSSQPLPVLDDQLESDRTRQFQEFLDDRVNHLKPALLISGCIRRCHQNHVGQKSEATNSLVGRPSYSQSRPLQWVRAFP